MSWPGSFEPENFNADENISSQVSWSAQSQPDVQLHRKHRSRKKDLTSTATWNMSLSEGNLSADGKGVGINWETRTESETDAQMNAVSSDPAEHRDNYLSENTEMMTNHDLLQTDVYNSEDANMKDVPKNKREKKKNKHKVNPETLFNQVTKVSKHFSLPSIDISGIVKSKLAFSKPGVQDSKDASNEEESMEQLIKKYQSRLSGTTGHTDELIDKDATKRFIASREVMQRECQKFVLSEKSGSCACGRTKERHSRESLQAGRAKGSTWKQDTCTKKVPCDCFGEIEFRGFGSSVHNSPYARVDIETDPSVIWELMIDYWKMPRPRLIISVTGGAQRFEIRPRLSMLLKQGLVEAALNTGAWIITGGTATGVMEFVGEAVRDHITVAGTQSDQCVALGIATWGCMANKQALDGYWGKYLWPATYATEDVKPSKGFTSLDPNHTHFLLVDDGREGHFGAEISFRSELESYISHGKKLGASDKQDVHIPVVLIVVEGGVGTMKTVKECIERNIPVVVISGSGRAADFIALAHKISQDPRKPEVAKFPADFDDKLRRAAYGLFVWKDHDTNKDKTITERINDLRMCLDKRNMINIFNLESSNSAKDIDRAILNALLKASKFENCKAQLALALAWDRCDIARQQIFIPENRNKWEIKDLEDAMFTALAQNKTDFVQLLLDNGVDLKRFLTTKTLQNLYYSCVSVEDNSEANILRHLMMFVQQSWVDYLRCQALEELENSSDILYCISKVITHLLRDKSYDFYPRWQKEEQTNGGSDGQAPTSAGLKKTHKKEGCELEHPERDLFIFAVLFNRIKMADLFLRRGINHIGTALLGSGLLRALSDQAEMYEETNISVNLLKNSQTLENFAVSVLDQCYQRSKTDSHLLLTRQIKHLGNMTPLLVADQQELMDFAEHSACQTKLTAIWKGNLTHLTSEIKVLLTIFFPFLIIFMKFDTVSNSSPDQSANKKEAKEAPQPNGMDHDKTASAVPKVGVKAWSKGTKFKEVRVFACRGQKGLGLFRALYYFYTAPVTKFYLNIIAYLVYLGLFSYFLLTNVRPVGEADSPSTIEYIVWAWFLTIVIEEVRQVWRRSQKSIRYKIRYWWNDFWNQFDFVMYLLMILSIILRCTLTESNFVYGRVMYSVTLAMFYLRFMQFFFAQKNMGPKVIMIRRMLTDLMFFFLILLVFVMSFGVAYHVNMFPNSPASWSILYNVLYFPYFQIYGELFVENLEGDDVNDCTRNETIWREDPLKRCPEQNVIVLILLAVYMMLTNILLVNLLIAMFSYTFQTVQEVSTKVWRFYRISLVYEYFDRPSLVPPVIVINHVWWLICCIFPEYNLSDRHNAFALQLSDDVNRRLSLFEKAAMELHLAHSSLREREQMDKRVATTSERLEQVMDDLQRIKEVVHHQETSHSNAETDTSVVPLEGASTSPDGEQA